MYEFKGNYSKELEEQVSKIMSVDELEGILKEYEVLLQKLILDRNNRIEEINTFFNLLEETRKKNEIIEVDIKKLLRRPIIRDWETYYKKFDENGGIELCEYKDLKKEEVLFESVCKIYGHDFVKCGDRIKITHDTSTPNVYSDRDGWDDELHLVSVGSSGTEYCQCNLCKRKYEIKGRPLDISDYMNNLFRSLSEKPKSFIKEKRHSIKNKRYDINDI